MRLRNVGMVFSLVALVLAGAAVEAAEVYRWVDADGRKHFTDHPPPPGIAVEKAALPAAPAPGQPAGGVVQGTGEPAADFARQLREKQQKMSREREKTRQQQQLSAEEERLKRAAQKQAQEREEKCRRLKDVADKAYGFKARYERECG